MSDLPDVGKATQAVAELTKEVRQLLYDFLSPGTREAGEWLADEIRLFRTRRRFRKMSQVLQQAHDLLTAAGIKSEPVRDIILIPALETSSLLEDEEQDLTAKWAGLLASASAGAAVHPGHVEILKQLSSDDARVLDAIYGHGWNSLVAESVRERVGLSFEGFTLVKENLVRLGLIRPGFEESRLPSNYGAWASNSKPTQPVFGDTSTIHTAKSIRLTPLGESFVATCRGPQAKL